MLAGCACCGEADVLPFQSAQDENQIQSLLAAMLETNKACAECILSSAGNASAMLACASEGAQTLVASLARGNSGTDPGDSASARLRAHSRRFHVSMPPRSHSCRSGAAMAELYERLPV